MNCKLRLRELKINFHKLHFVHELQTALALWKYYDNDNEVVNSRTRSVHFTALAISRKATLFISLKNCRLRRQFFQTGTPVLKSQYVLLNDE